MITTLIPAYKHQYLSDLLLSLANQTFKDFRVIISDDSPENQVIKTLNSPEFKGLVQKLDIRIIEGPKKGSMKNVLTLLDAWNHTTPMVHILFDDDYIFPSFYQLHTLAHMNENVGSSVSFRWVGDQNLLPTQTSKLPLFISQSSKRSDLVSSNQLFSTVIENCTNWLGEFSNAVFSANVIDLIRASKLADYSYYGLGDIGLFLQSSLNTNTIVIKDHLGVFRKNPFQNTGNLKSRSMQASYIAWIALALGSLKLGKVNDVQAEKCIRKISNLMAANFKGEKEVLSFAELINQHNINSIEFQTKFNYLWNIFLSKDISWSSSTQGSTL